MERDDELILAAASMFQAAALQHLGKLANPLTQQAEVDLAEARLTIDIIAALQQKTAGRLDAEARQALEAMLFGLRMNFLDEARKAERTAAHAAVGDAAPAAAPATAGDSAPSAPPATDRAAEPAPGASSAQASGANVEVDGRTPSEGAAQDVPQADSGAA